jgi:hypothetical protein
MTLPVLRSNVIVDADGLDLVKCHAAKATAESEPVAMFFGPLKQTKLDGVIIVFTRMKMWSIITRIIKELIMDKQERKAAVADYKERKSACGIYAVICKATGETWVGTSRNLEAQKNSLWFTLNSGSGPFRILQKVWKEHGEREFRFEELDRLKVDFSNILQADELRKRQKLWLERLRALPL